MCSYSLVELHIHLEGAVRHETILELLKKRGLKLPGNGTVEDLKQAMVIDTPRDLAHFLKPIGDYVAPVIRDIDVAERVAYEFCQDMCRNHVKYVEARYAPHNFLPEQAEVSELSALEQVVKAVNRGFERGQSEFGVKARQILCGLNGTDQVLDILPLSQKFKNEGVVGIDMATKQGVTQINDEVLLDPKAIYLYEEARKCAIHRTLHAGESGGPDMIQRALDCFHTERIGHGYHVIEDESVYSRCKRDNIHLECCPWSSLLTGAVSSSVKQHPIVRFAKDNVNFSINSDDPVVTGRWIADDYELAKSWGISDAKLKQIVTNAASNSFLPESEKKELMTLL